ncbi:MAG: restriction endonuclease [Egibacteraceae bacterium]
MPDLRKLDLGSLKATATQYARLLGETPIPELFGVTDGKAVGTYIEAGFNTYIGARFTHDRGNAATGIDFPGLEVDLKVTSIRQPQSSSPFRDAKQKVYGLGYHLLVFVYKKADDPALSAARLEFLHVIFIDKQFTADFQTTQGLRRILDSDGNVDDIDAFLHERNLPLDDIGRRGLAELIIDKRPPLGCLTISNALQWRPQYSRAIQMAATPADPGPENLLA